MLMLTRRVGDSVRIGDDIEVIVVEMKHGQVRLGIKAPPAVKVLRGELDAHSADPPRPGSISDSSSPAGS